MRIFTVQWKFQYGSWQQKIVYKINTTVLLYYIHTHIHTHTYTYIRTLCTHNNIYEVGVFFRIITAHISSVLTLCQIKNTLYKPNAIQTRRLPLIIMYAVHLPATKQNTTQQLAQVSDMWKAQTTTETKGSKRRTLSQQWWQKTRHRILMTVWQWH
jgi:hypothetical protein